MNKSLDVEYVAINRFDKVAFTCFHNLPKAIADNSHASSQIRFFQKQDVFDTATGTSIEQNEHAGVILEDDGKHKRPSVKSVLKETGNVKGVAKGMYVDLESMVEFAKDGIVSKTLVKMDSREVSLFCMSTGQTISTHKSSFPATIHIIQGSGIVTLHSETYQAKPCAWFYMPAQLPHAIEATSNLVFLLTLFKQTEKRIQKR